MSDVALKRVDEVLRLANGGIPPERQAEWKSLFDEALADAEREAKAITDPRESEERWGDLYQRLLAEPRFGPQRSRINAAPPTERDVELGAWFREMLDLPDAEYERQHRLWKQARLGMSAQQIRSLRRRLGGDRG